MDDTFIGNCDMAPMLMWLTSCADYHVGSPADFRQAVVDDDGDDAIVDLMVLGNNGPRTAIFSTSFTTNAKGDTLRILVTSDYGQIDIP